MRLVSGRAAVLLTGLVAAAALLAQAPVEVPGDGVSPAPAPARLSADTAWPGVARTDLPVRLPGRVAALPVLVVPGMQAALIVAPATDSAADRLLLWRADGGLQELRRHDRAGPGSGFTAFTASDGEVVWAETDPRGRVSLWAAEVRDGASARRITDRMGDVSFGGGPSDLVLAGGRIHWAASVPGGESTEIRSVAAVGGAVDVRRVPGLWTFARWPWLREHQLGRAGSASLRNLVTGAELRAPASDDGLVRCGPVWCQVWVPRRRGPARLDLMRVDGSDRRTLDDGGADAVGEDVAVLDRFVLLTVPEPNASVIGAMTVLVHDTRAHRTVVVAAGASEVGTHDAVVWWSTGTGDAMRWTVLDLRAIRP